jgi:hypothetical protein
MKYFNKHILLLALVFIVQNVSSQAIKGTFAIKNIETGKLLRPKDASKSDGAPIVMYNPVNWKCMTWDFQHVEDNTYQLENLFSGKTFQAEDKVLQTGSLLEQAPIKKGSDLQSWEFVEVKKDIYLIKLKGNDKYLTPVDENGATNSRVALEEKMNGNLQHWTIYMQNPSF